MSTRSSSVSWLDAEGANELDFDPFCEEDKYPDKAPNEVCVGFGRGRHLAIKDKAVLYGKALPTRAARYASTARS